ncbi:alpha/beta hydrolase [Paraglaciecola aquimarina]|uniref:Alpha/beta hydrolase n=1 Tax=Paraglaciecola aquimarina TaxID=1235557 RepID=A0ABU3T1B4_9ALTE|nr:alpha/beta hydrolase [Paraglaciecola aquimarina]MDU0356038.1 alpha/beta hydrolase [Paraglaciecola aquimarina]
MKTIVTKSGISINYQAQGDKSAPVIIMIMGLGAQMTIWPDELYLGLVDKGYRVIRFDNRDVGLSSQLEEWGNPSLLKAWLSKRLPNRYSTPYKLEDMAKDVLELMAALKIKKAHFVGASMGGMIAQILASQHKKKVLSLTSIMSATSPIVSASNLKIMLKLGSRPRMTNSEAAIRYNIRMNQLIGSPAYPRDELSLHKQAKRSIERAYNPLGVKRQLAALTASGDRRSSLHMIKAPTLVIHGADDPIIPRRGGEQTAESIRKAKLKIVQGMGHDFPPELMQKMTKWIAKHVKKAEKNTR